MKYTILLLVFLTLPTYAAKPESKQTKDQRACRAEADAAVRSAKLKSPADVTTVKDTTYNKCMRGKSYAMPPIREK